MLTESKFEEKIDMLTNQISELKDKITRLENMLLLKTNFNDYSDYSNYNISNDVNMDNVIDKSISFSEPPPLVRQNAFNK